MNRPVKWSRGETVWGIKEAKELGITRGMEVVEIEGGRNWAGRIRIGSIKAGRIHTREIQAGK